MLVLPLLYLFTYSITLCLTGDWKLVIKFSGDFLRYNIGKQLSQSGYHLELWNYFSSVIYLWCSPLFWDWVAGNLRCILQKLLRRPRQPVMGNLSGNCIHKSIKKLTKIRNNPGMFAVPFSDVNCNLGVVLCKIHDFFVDILSARDPQKNGKKNNTLK